MGDEYYVATRHVLKCAPCNCHDSAFNDIISLGILQPFPKLVCAAAASPFVCEKAMSRFSTVLRWMLFLRTHGLIAGNYPERTSSRKSDARNKRGARSSAATLAMLHSKVPKSSLPKRLRAITAADITSSPCRLHCCHNPIVQQRDGLAEDLWPCIAACTVHQGQDSKQLRIAKIRSCSGSCSGSPCTRTHAG